MVSTDPHGPTVDTLRRLVEHAEGECAATAPRGVPHELPGDDVLLVRRGVSAATAGTGLALTAAGRYLRLPRLPGGAAAPVLVSDYHPRIRTLVESALGAGRADLLLAAGTSVLHTLTLSPASSAVEAATRTVLVGETLAMRRAWRDFEPDLAPHAAAARCSRRPDRPTEPPAGPIERYTDRAGWAGLAGAAAAGLLTGRPTTAGSAALVAVPKASRTARESFAATLARGLAARGVLPLRPAVLRRLDRVDAIVVDPRALYTAGLAVTRLCGVPDRDRSAVWDRARTAVERGVLTPGWHPVSAVPDVPGHLPADARVLIGPVHDRYASAVLAAARRAGIAVVSVEDEGAGSLRNGFDRLEPLVESMDAALLGIVERLQRGGGTVVVLTAEAAQALALADVGIGVLRDGGRPPWPADLMVRDLTGAWRILHALPAARTASRRGVEIARDASALGALLMLPGVPGTGPESVTAGAAAGLWAGTSAARTALAAPLPPPRSTHDWHALSVDEVCALLPAPSPDELFWPAAVSGWRVRTRARAVRAGRRVGTRPVGSAVDFTRAMRTELSDPLTPVLATGSAASAVLGVAVRLVTGDHPVTAVAIAGELGLSVTADQVHSGAEWDGLSHTERERAVEERLVFARMSSEHKVQIVQTLEHAGHVCAMVGDGANDAAAIRAASVGIGVASRGSDPARGAADVVLLEGRVAGLLDALDEGRVLWQRVQAAVSVLLGGNAGEVAFALLGSLITGRSPLNARQLLLVNMLTDALPAAALAVSTPRIDGSRLAHRPDESVLLHAVAARGATTAAAATAAWAMARVTGSNPRASTVALVGAQLGQTLLESRSPLVVATVLGSLAAMAALISTPGVSGLLGCVPVGPVGWTQALGCAAAATVVAAVAPTVALRLPAIGEVVTSVLEPRDAGGASGNPATPTPRFSPTSGLQ
ncbi:cation-translocating P-type ATPase [Rhodococcus sp. 14C212]|nr:cation-translocating P-type ATPase [Rhodococcus sp. 14C212]